MTEVRPDEIVLEEAERLCQIDGVSGGSGIELEPRCRRQLAGDVVREVASNGGGARPDDFGHDRGLEDLVVGSGDETDVDQ